MWTEALRRAEALGRELGGLSAYGVPRVTDAMLLPFEPAQQKFASALAPRYIRRLPSIPPTPADGSRRAVPHAAIAVERSASEFADVALSAASTALTFGGPLSAGSVDDLVCAIVEAHSAALVAALPPLITPPRSDALLQATFEGTMEECRDALSLLRAVQGLRERVDSFGPAVYELKRKAADASEAAPVQTAARHKAATIILQTSDSAGGYLRASASASSLLYTSQRLALECLIAPVSASLRRIASPELFKVWRGKDEEEELASGMLAFSASPQGYITTVGDHLLGLPQRLEPFAAGTTLTLLDKELKGSGSLSDDEEGLHTWLAALGHRVVELLLQSVALIPTLSILGAKQLAADASYVDNILSGGLGLPHDARLVELVDLLTTAKADLSAAVAAAHALPRELPAALAEKRGVAI